ncbi:MAG: restriction endonuclease subunit S [Muribaculaceae bacterium]|nr:restriction endonuclease subunit S [Muribaculaceae bacterium]
MEKERKVPQIRFKEFLEEWEETKLGEIFDIRNGYTPSKAVKSFWENGTIPWFRMEDIRLNGRILNDSIQHITPLAIKGSGLYPAGSYIISTTATIGEHALLIVDSLANQRFSFLLKKLNRWSGFDEMFFFYIMYALCDWCKANINAGGLAAVSIQDLLKYTFIIPQKREEQINIAKTLMQLDNLITLTDQKLTKLRNIKKACLEKMFPKEGENIPEIRFKGFSEEWEENRLGDIGKPYIGLSGKTKEDFGHGDASFVTYMNVFTNPISKTNATENVEIDTKQNEVKYGDVFFTVSSETPEEVGMTSVWLSDMQNVYLNSFCFGYRLSINYDPYYIAYYLRSNVMRKKICYLAQGISRFNISKTKMMDINILLPNIEEQERIGLYFKELEKKISKTEQKLTKLRNIKKACLEKMFV